MQSVHETKTVERDTNLAADSLLVLLAALVSALRSRFDAEAGPASAASDLTSGAGGFPLVLEQLHQQVKLGTAAHLQSQTEQLMQTLNTAGNIDLLKNKLTTRHFALDVLLN